MKARIAKSAPGQATPKASPIQNRPNDDSITPTTNLSAFSGTRAKGRCNISPIAATNRHAAVAAALTAIIVPRRRAHCNDDKHDFEPIEQHRLEARETGKPIQMCLVTTFFFAQFGGLTRVDRPTIKPRGRALESVIAPFFPHGLNGYPGARARMTSIGPGKGDGHDSRFAEAIGVHAKTDIVNAAMLARLGAMLEPPIRPALSQALDDMK